MFQHKEVGCAVCGKDLPNIKLVPDGFKIICENCLTRIPKGGITKQ